MIGLDRTKQVQIRMGQSKRLTIWASEECCKITVTPHATLFLVHVVCCLCVYSCEQSQISKVRIRFLTIKDKVPFVDCFNRPRHVTCCAVFQWQIPQMPQPLLCSFHLHIKKFTRKSKYCDQRKHLVCWLLDLCSQYLSSPHPIWILLYSIHKHNDTFNVTVDEMWHLCLQPALWNPNHVCKRIWISEADKVTDVVRC